jgi:hypothetical protein
MVALNCWDLLQLPETIKLGFATIKGEKVEITYATVGKAFRKDVEMIVTGNNGSRM